MKIAVFGSGGVGGYFGGRLAQAGEDVFFIARGEHLRQIQTAGLRVDSIQGDFIVSPARATDDPAQVGYVDVILVAVKTWSVPEAARLMRPMVGEQTFLVPLENGVEAPDQLASVLGKQHVLGGICQISSALVAPGHIRHVGIEPFISFGELDGHASERVEKLRQTFEGAGVKVAVSPDIRLAMWDKFLFIAAVGGVGAVARAPIGILRSVAETRRLLLDAMREIVAVAKARGVNLTDEAVMRRLAFIDGMPPGVTASMHRDILESKPSELESQNGALVRLGRELGVPTPTHAFLYASLLPQEERARGEIQW
jgi:2-dehydropantoate 2-reductase